MREARGASWDYRNKSRVLFVGACATAALVLGGAGVMTEMAGTSGAAPARGPGAALPRSSRATARPVLAPDLRPLLKTATRLGALAPSTVLHLTMGLKGREQAALNRLLDRGKSLSAAEYNSRFGPDPVLVGSAEKWFASHGLAPSWAPGNAILSVEGPAGRVESAFSVSLGRYRVASPGTTPINFYAPDGQPWLPSRLLSVVDSVLGLDDYPAISKLDEPVAQASGSCKGPTSPDQVGGFTPSEVTGFYNFGPLYRGGLSGAGQTVVFMEIDGYLQSDLQEYASAFSLPPFNVVGPIVNAAWGTNGPISFGNACGSETELDLEVVHAMAPQAKLVDYEAGSNGPPLASVATMLQAAIGTYPRGIYNLSLGWCEDAATARQFEGLFTQLTARGGTAFVSSGDNGAYARGCPHNLTIENPADAPHATAVGGTTALAGVGSTYGEEASWGDPFSQWGAGGGLSTVFPRPSWQTGPGVSNQYSNGMRQVPDVSSIADINTGWDTCGGGVWGVTGGTSAAAPLWAALTALTDQALAGRSLPPVGFANPALYDFGSNPSHFPAKAFHTVTQGNNLFYVSSSNGWNFGTGWGTPIATGIVDDFIDYEKASK